MAVNYNDERFQKVESDKQQALTENEQLYGGMIKDSEGYYQAQIDASKQWADKQTQLQQEQTDFAIEKIEQQKDQATKDYKKEQSGAYVDWQKQSNQYGSNAEMMAAQGLANTGYSESSQVSMYNTYQSRVATARESYNRAILNYDNAIKDAQLQNNSILAEIAYNALQQQLELSLQGFQYKNQLLIEQANKKTEIGNIYHNRYQDVLDQINTENALAEEIRQYNQNYALQQAQLAEEKRQFNASLAEEQRQYNASLAASQAKSSGSGGSSSGKGSGSSGSSKSGSSSGSSKAFEVATAYYRGDKNSDADKFGTFNNGYQPKGISGHGTLAKTGQTIEIKTRTLYGQNQVVVQNVWRAQDGTKWYWEGRQNQYIQIG